LFLVKDMTDESLLCDFIIGLKSVQFLTLGCKDLVFGCVKMYW
jgi:hypothetical protein